MLKRLFKVACRLLRSKTGAETVEFVAILSLVLFISFGFLSLSTGMLAKLVVVDAARESARAVALELDTAENASFETIAGSGFKVSDDKLITTTDTTSDPNYVIVDVSFKVPSIIPGLPKLIGREEWGDYFTVSSKSRFKKER